MSRRSLDITLNTLAYLGLLSLIFTGTIIHFILPHGSPRQGLTWMGADRHAWGRLHGWLALCFVMLLLLHLGSHWAWIRRLARGDDKASDRRRRYGELLLDLGVLGLAAAFSLPFIVK